MKVLIAEGNVKMRHIIRHLVTELADEIVECGDGVEALARYHELHPDWVLMDIELPGQNGITATRELLATEPTARVLIVTSYDDADLRQAAAAAGACGYVLKENLLELRHWLQVRSANETTNPNRLPPAEKGTPQ